MMTSPFWSMTGTRVPRIEPPIDAIAAEQAGPTEDDRGDRLQVVGLVTDDVRIGVARDVDDRRDPDEHAHQDEQPEGVAVDVDAGPDRGVLRRADRQRPEPEARPAQEATRWPPITSARTSGYGRSRAA